MPNGFGLVPWVDIVTLNFVREVFLAALGALEEPHDGGSIKIDQSIDLSIID